VSPNTLANEVRFLNDAVAASKRRVDFVHLPLLDRTDLGYSAPLSDLKVGNAEVYLGLIHNMDTFKQRLDNARKYLREFKFAAPCGFGRISREQLQAVHDDHVKALDIFRH
jgi:hypothetical protein